MRFVRAEGEYTGQETLSKLAEMTLFLTEPLTTLETNEFTVYYIVHRC